MVKHTTKLTVLALLTALLLCTRAQATEVETSATVTYTSDYLFRGLKLGKSAIQPEVEVTAGDFTLNIWSNQPLRKIEDPEYDFNLGYALTFNKLTVTPTAKYYAYPKATDQKHTFEPGVEFNYALVTDLNLVLNTYYDVDLRATTIEGGANYTMTIGELKITPSVVVGQVSARDAEAGAPVYVRESYNYLMSSVAVSYTFTKQLTATVTGGYGGQKGFYSGISGDHAWASIGTTWSF